MTTQAPFEIDERGTRCPHPIIELGKFARAHSGKGLRVVLLADDIAAKSDVPAWCRLTNSTLLSVNDLADGSGLRFEIQL